MQELWQEGIVHRLMVHIFRLQEVLMEECNLGESKSRFIGRASPVSRLISSVFLHQSNNQYFELLEEHFYHLQ